MKTLLVKGFLASALVGATACSKVSFAPGDLTNNSVQNTPDGVQQETFAFDDDNSMSKVDILFVDDNSGSMLDKQQKLSTKLSAFVGSLANVNWQIAITTTDTSNGRWGLKGGFVDMVGANTKILTANTPNYETVFRNSIVRSEMFNCGLNCPSDDERPLQAVVEAVAKRGGENAAFFRPNSDFVVVFLSDEDEKYAESGMPVDPQSALNAIRASLPNTKFTAYGIITRPGDTGCYNEVSQVSGKYGEYMASLIGMTGGVAGSICDADYSSSLTAIGNRVRENAGTITLKYLPFPDTLQLIIAPFDPSLTWSIEGQSIRFNKQPKKGTRIDVRYLPH